MEKKEEKIGIEESLDEQVPDTQQEAPDTRSDQQDISSKEAETSPDVSESEPEQEESSQKFNSEESPETADQAPEQSEINKTVATDTESNEESLENTEFEQMLEESLGNIFNLEIGDKVEGEIINITDSFIFATLGGKHDVYAEKIDYLDKNGDLTLQIGDKITGYVIKNTETETFIAQSLVSVNKSVLKEAYEEQIPVSGKVVSTIKGGYQVNISGVKAFCPQSQIDNKVVKDIQQYIGKNFDFRMIDFDDTGRNIVVSRRVLLDEEAARMKADTMANLEIGAVVTGKITRLTNFGAFADLGGIEGLIHISEFSWTRVDSPSEILNIGDEVKVKIIKMNGEKISLSMKALQENPFDAIIEDLNVGDIISCRVLRNLPFGSFVEIKPGVEGLIPISELTLGRRIAHPSEILSEGDMVEAQIMKVNPEDRKISLSLKALQPDPWNEIDDILQEDEVITGTIENVANFGAFINLKEGVVGLMPNSKIKLAGLKLDRNSIGQEIKVRIVNVDLENKRISLEPSTLPETVEEKGDDWRKYKKDKRTTEASDSPFADL